MVCKGVLQGGDTASGKQVVGLHHLYTASRAAEKNSNYGDLAKVLVRIG